jgi:hypothetical protein
MNILFDNAALVDRWLKEQGGGVFLIWVEEIHERWMKMLKKGDTDVDVFRAQGAVEVLDSLLGLQQDLREFLQRMTTGAK